MIKHTKEFDCVGLDSFQKSIVGHLSGVFPELEYSFIYGYLRIENVYPLDSSYVSYITGFISGIRIGYRPKNS